VTEPHCITSTFLSIIDARFRILKVWVNLEEQNFTKCVQFKTSLRPGVSHSEIEQFNGTAPCSITTLYLTTFGITAHSIIITHNKAFYETKTTQSIMGLIVTLNIPILSIITSSITTLSTLH
jgi:hypothetical protein